MVTKELPLSQHGGSLSQNFIYNSNTLDGARQRAPLLKRASGIKGRGYPPVGYPYLGHLTIASPREPLLRERLPTRATAERHRAGGAKDDDGSKDWRGVAPTGPH